MQSWSLGISSVKETVPGAGGSFWLSVSDSQMGRS